MFFIVSVAAVLFVASQAREFQFLNTMNEEIWVGIQGNTDYDILNDGGLILPPSAQKSVLADGEWSGRFWGRTGCDPHTKFCETGNCGNRLHCGGRGGAPPVTMAEITLGAGREYDTYYISLIYGFNVPVSVQPLGSDGDDSLYSCAVAQCYANIYGDCPDEMRVVIHGRIVGCKSACLAFNSDEYCGNRDNTARTWKAYVWPIDYGNFYKDRCPDAYSSASDERNITFTCGNPPVYRIQFGA